MLYVQQVRHMQHDCDKRDTSVTTSAQDELVALVDRSFVCNVYKVIIAVIRFNKRINCKLK